MWKKLQRIKELLPDNWSWLKWRLSIGMMRRTNYTAEKTTLAHTTKMQTRPNNKNKVGSNTSERKNNNNSKWRRNNDKQIRIETLNLQLTLQFSISIWNYNEKVHRICFECMCKKHATVCKWDLSLAGFLPGSLILFGIIVVDVISLSLNV